MSSAKHIHGSHVLVTGGNRGIGLAFVHALLQRGAAKVYLGTRDLGNLQLTPEQQTRVQALVLNVNDSASIAQAVAQIPHLDLLINNAGTATGMTYTHPQALAVAAQEMDTNYFGPLRLVQALLPQLQASRNAGIINVSSIAGLSNFRVLGPYSASKAAVHFLTQGLRAELQAHSVHVLGVYPGPVDTRMAAGFEMEKASPDQVAQAVLDGYEAGLEDVFPDAFSQHMAQLLQQDRKAMERAFAA